MMKMYKFRIVWLALLIGTLSACGTTHRPAPITERAFASSEGSPPVVDARVSYVVKKGDTLFRIAQEVGQSYGDLVAWNRLANPDDIKINQVLRIAPPDFAALRNGTAQTGTVAISSGVEARQLSAPAVSMAENKSSPRGDKRPYSEAALAEMQRAEVSEAPMVGAAVPTKPAVDEKVADVRPPLPATTASEDDTVSWMWPAEGKVIANFDDGKKGIDIVGKTGQQILAASAGKVMYAGSGIRGYGNLVIVKHTSSLLSAYAHNKVISVKEGQMVAKGQKIAEMGNSDAESVKLHFEIRQQGKPVDPAKFLPKR